MYQSTVALALNPRRYTQCIYIHCPVFVGKRSIFRLLCTSWMLLCRLSLILEYSLTQAASGGTAANLCSLFRGRKLIKLVGYALPEMPLSVGSKLKRCVNVRILPRMYTCIIHVLQTQDSVCIL